MTESSQILSVHYPRAEVTYLFGDTIFAPDVYSDLWSLLEDANRGTVVHVHFNTSGGSLNTALQFYAAMQTTQATVIGHAVGEVSSAGSLMFHSCHEAVVHPFSFFLYHQGSRFCEGKLNETLTRSNFLTSHMGRIYREIYKHVLTEEEIDRVLGGEDIHLSGEEVGSRLQETFDIALSEIELSLDEEELSLQ